MALLYFLLWKTYKKALLSFVSAQDEVAASDKQPRRPQAILAVGIIVAVAIAILVGVFYSFAQSNFSSYHRCAPDCSR